jgi:hypothetical protein
MDSSRLATEIRSALEANHPDQLPKRVFLILDRERGNPIDRPDLFDRAVIEAFPSAEDDIHEAGNCLAAHCNTAAVFHLMRVAEVGLKTFARDRRVKLPRKEPLDLAAWESIIRGLEAAEDAIRQYPKTAAQASQYVFHHKAMTEFSKFGDVFRNQVMNTRELFGPDRAISVLEDVRTFMQTLACHISEKSRTPLVWKGKKWLEHE